MEIEDSRRIQEARTAPVESLSVLLASSSEEVLFAVLENPGLDETHLCALLERKDLPGTLIAEISKRKKWQSSYCVRLALAAHPHTPRLIAMRVLRDLHLMDLVRISLLPTSTGELRRLAEERVLAQLPQLPLGQRLTLAKRGSSRVAAGLMVQGPEQVARAALDNPFLTESHLLKTLAKETLSSETVATVVRHGKWSKLVNVRVALMRHRHVPEECIAVFAADLPRRAIEDLLGCSRLSGPVRDQLRRELARRESESLRKE